MKHVVRMSLHVEMESASSKNGFVIGMMIVRMDQMKKTVLKFLAQAMSSTAPIVISASLHGGSVMETLIAKTDLMNKYVPHLGYIISKTV